MADQTKATPEPETAVRTMARLTVLAALLAGCQSLSTADLQRCLSQHGVVVTAGEAPPGAEPIAAVAFQRNGFYLAGLIPVVRVELDDAVQSIALALHAADADGISNLRYDYSPASLFKFLVFPVPDWSATLSVTGMAYRLPDTPACSVSPSSISGSSPTRATALHLTTSNGGKGTVGRH